MSGKNKKLNIELRSEDVQDILNRQPNWMIRWGNSVLIAIVLIGLILSYYVKYPDVIVGEATVSSITPPVIVSTQVGGRIRALHIANKENVGKDQVIAEIENPIPLNSIDSLRQFLDLALNFMKDSTNADFQRIQSIHLFEITPEFLELKNGLEQYHSHLFSQSQFQQLEDLRSKLNAHLKLYEISKREEVLSKTDIEFAKEKFEMQKEEHELGLTSKLDLLNAQTVFNQSLKQEESLKKSQIQMELTIQDYKSQINSFLFERDAKMKEYRNQIFSQITRLNNYITRWKTDYIIESPVAGTLDYAGRIKKDQLVSAGDRLFAIIPPVDELEVMIELPSQGFGKLDIGQKVRLKLNNYPHQEYGYINGSIKSMSFLPQEETYLAQAALDNGLLSSYNIKLEYSPEMSAVAEVITEDLRLIERLFNSIKSIFDN